MNSCNKFKVGDKGQRFEIRFINEKNIEQYLDGVELKKTQKE